LGVTGGAGVDGVDGVVGLPDPPPPHPMTPAAAINPIIPKNFNANRGTARPRLSTLRISSILPFEIKRKLRGALKRFTTVARPASVLLKFTNAA
jgi:hypothetical protein